ncbi:hypothetical protein [Gymnodinialimonas ceratoperidinii]|uniref:Uncharacterized protein n=1 Tax=Gymnodinialimonas ceratoperidinii TaxID=2856823 RepID=A0A8F6TTZ1_9RHOB|nr:hypothetical protein [Gymnodinialimonas ceratoperidinii]QXT38134.1 hypothetical protein KYE46_09200 [Gymnodinialimonas ceratoperidinii]
MRIEIYASDLNALRASPDRAAIAYAVLHTHAQAGQHGAPDQLREILRRVLYTPEVELAPWLTAHARAHNGAVSHHLHQHIRASMPTLQMGRWLPLPRTSA